VTVFIGDFSHYDDNITPAVAARIKADGIVAVSHKISEGTGGYDVEAGEAFNSFRGAGFDLIGAYAVPRTGDGRAQARVAIARADAIAPWWRSFPGWFWQVDLERWPYDAVPAVDGREMADEFATTGKRVVVYASHSQYGNQLAGWPYPLWNADYATSREAPYRDLYPGDSWTPLHGSGSSAWRGGWTPYSGQTPTFLQYASSATIGGLTTCDVSAYRGTVDQLRALLTGRAVTPSSTGADMEQSEKLIRATGFDGRVVGDVLADLQNLRSFLYSAPGAAGLVNPPLPGSVAGLLSQLVANPPTGAAPSQEQVDAAVKTALSDPAVLAGLVKAINDDAAARLAQ
jgi:hypothetical protein